MSALAESVSRPELWGARIQRVRPRGGEGRPAPARAMVPRAKLNCISALRPGVSRTGPRCRSARSEEHTSEPPVTFRNLVCRLLLDKKINGHKGKRWGGTKDLGALRAATLID